MKRNERERSLGAYGGNNDARGLSTRGEYHVGDFSLGPNGGLVFNGRNGVDMVFGVRRGDMVRGTSKRPKKAGNGKL